MKASLTKKLSHFFLLLVFISGGLFFLTRSAYGVARTWDGGGTDGTCGGGAGDGNKWTCAANWTGDTVPTSADTAVFDGTSTKNATINANLSGGTAPLGISINAGYTGTITQATGVTISIGASGFSQAAGTFTGGDSAITISSGSFTLSGGTFTSTTGTLSVFADWTHTAGGTWNHNNGTVSFGTGGSSNGTLDVATSETFNNFTSDRNSGALHYSTIASGDTVIVLGTFTHSNGGIRTGTIEARGSVSIGATAGPGFANNDATISFLVTGDQTISAAAGSETGKLNINKSSGTVSVSSSDLAIYAFTLSSGTFTAPTGTLSVFQNWTHTAGGTWNHNNGTVQFGTAGTNGTLDVATSETFNNFTSNRNGGANEYSTIASGDTVIVLGTFTHSNGGIRTGTIEARGSVSIGATAGPGFANNDATISFLVTGDQTISAAAGSETGKLNINKSSGTVSVSSSDLAIYAFTLSSGTFTAPTGTLSVFQNWTHTAGGTWNHNNGTVQFGTAGTNGTLDVATSETFNNFTSNRNGGANEYSTIASGDTVIVLGTFTHLDGSLATGTVEARGNVVISVSGGSGSGVNTATLSFTGSGDQTYTDQGGDEPDGDITVNKSGGTLTLASNADWNAAGQDLVITAGTLAVGTGTLAATTVTVASEGRLQMTSTGDLTLGGTLTNNGAAKIWGNGTCGGADDVLIRSSLDGTQRSWNGTGAFSIYDADIKDMAGTASITVYSCTNSTNNGANWTFSGAACPAIAPAAGLSSGLINLGSGVINLR